jgi:threonine dehydratase
VGSLRDDPEALVSELAEREGLTVVHPYDDPLIMAGAGTSTLELLETARLDLIVIPAGGGGQLSGGAVAADGARADGQQLRAPGEQTFAVIRALVEDVVGVQDAQMLDAMRYLFERQKLVVEPSGASALAALLSGLIDVRGMRVGVILSGGNIGIDRFLDLIKEQPSCSR